MKNYFVLIAILGLVSSCSGGKGPGSFSSLFGGDSSTPETPEVPVNVVETAKLQEAIQADPEYKIDNSEIETLKAEGIIKDEDLSQIQAIQ